MTGIDNLVCALIASPSLRPNFVRKSLDSDLESRNIQMGMRKRSLPIVHFPSSYSKIYPNIFRAYHL